MVGLREPLTEGDHPDASGPDRGKVRQTAADVRIARAAGELKRATTDARVFVLCSARCANRFELGNHDSPKSSSFRFVDSSHESTSNKILKIICS
jgi:hypothetical protein